ncbi:MAG: hypothetical protein SFY66_06865 [Oculatellaceae cyanobacterium bins.114]|nr:hypothetical protein [Oculatellaceae cyanobacterium bins.114]
MKQKQLRLYLIIFGLLGLGLIVLLLSRFNIAVQVESDPANQPTVEVTPSPLPSRDRSSSPKPSTIPTPSVTPPTQTAPTASQFHQGSLRVSNQTEHPIRVALLHRPAQSNSQSESNNAVYGEPVHWDFAPNEGSTKGLILSLPNENLKLQPGDVLVAFAQDGSRRYWGPYVVGTTIAPVWDNNTGEWQLILQPAIE